jgi:hypothetical protein
MARIKKKRNTDLEIEDFKYLSDLNLALPQLVLGIEFPKASFGSEYQKTYKFKPNRQFHKIVHETRGMSRNQRYLIGTLLTPKPEFLKSIENLADDWFETGTGAVKDVSLSSINSYSKELKMTLKADCNSCWRSFEEAYYPIDAEYAHFLAVDLLPKNLDDLIDFDSGYERAIDSINRWKLVILGKNSN